MHPVDPRPEHGPEGRGAAGERERHSASGEDDPGAGAQAENTSGLAELRNHAFDVWQLLLLSDRS